MLKIELPHRQRKLPFHCGGNGTDINAIEISSVRKWWWWW